MNYMNGEKSKFDKLYTDISSDIARSTAEIVELRIDHAKGREEIGCILEKLRGIQDRFDNELDLLRNHVEWDRFTLAFFGETNAGKSTIIDSLRILFEEEGRQKLLVENAHDLEAYEAALTVHVERAQEALQGAFQEHARELLDIRARISAVSNLVREEVASRVRRRMWLMGAAGLTIGVALAASLFVLLGR